MSPGELNFMQTELTQTILQKIPLLTEEQQQKILEITENYLSGERAANGWGKLKRAIAENKIDSGLGDFAEQHDYYIYGAEKRRK